MTKTVHRLRSHHRLISRYYCLPIFGNSLLGTSQDLISFCASALGKYPFTIFRLTVYILDHFLSYKINEFLHYNKCFCPEMPDCELILFITFHLISVLQSSRLTTPFTMMFKASFIYPVPPNCVHSANTINMFISVPWSLFKNMDKCSLNHVVLIEKFYL